MQINIFQKGFNFSQNGPGNRLVYHIQGCNMSCPWCSNPEGMHTKGAVMALKGVRDDSCPFGAIEDGIFNNKLCKTCKRPCLDAQDENLKLSCTAITEQDLIKEAIRSKAMYFGGGGVTFTGGEPTLDLPMLTRLLRALKQNNIHTAIESNGSHPDLSSVLEYVDFFIMDLKHHDDEKHRKTTGIASTIIKRNLKHCSTISKILLRIPLVKGFNAEQTDAHAFAELIEQCNKDNITVEFLRFHDLGKVKWAQCGMQYAMQKSAYVGPETIKMFTDIFEQYGIKTIKTEI